MISKDCKENKIEHYIILTANNYELCKDYRCVWIPDLIKLENFTYDEFLSKYEEVYYARNKE